MDKIKANGQNETLAGRPRASRNGQVWFPDFMIASFIFVVIAVLFTVFLANQESHGTNIDVSAIDDANAISNMLITQGNPTNWTAGSVNFVGLTNPGKRLNSTKFASLAALDYNRARTIMGTKHDFIVYFQDVQGNQITVGGLDVAGKAGVTPGNIESQDAGDIARVGRFVLLSQGTQSDIVEMVIYVWN
ncbi:MAG: hypothetical protein QS98_C0007G0003 [archaeon GW2011_AR3]|nr:MAG: hypothetical protein QS98_C0007G0003 [archaeon GW2011_AR3]MBS3108914.1 hypothetical protein [Candidatus Woesearchaeota archaeon]